MGDFISGLFGVIQLLIVAASNLLKTSNESSGAFNEAWAATWGGGSTLYRVGFVLGIFLYIIALERIGKGKTDTSETHSKESDSDQKNPCYLAADSWKGPWRSKLHDATESGDSSSVKALLDAGANVEARKRGLTALSLAAYKGHTAIVELLIEAGADVNARTSTGLTPLHAAAAEDHADTAELLVARGADVNARAKDGYTPLLLAYGLRHSDIAKFLIKSGADISTQDKNNNTLLHGAAEVGDVQSAGLFLDSGININALNKDGATPLCLALAHKEVHFAKWLISRGADTSITYTEHALSPLHLAASCGLPSVVRSLIEHGVDVDLKSGKEGVVPLHMAVDGDHIEVVRILLKEGADVNATDKYQQTPLFIAQAQGKHAITSLLCNHGAKQ